MKDRRVFLRTGEQFDIVNEPTGGVKIIAIGFEEEFDANVFPDEVGKGDGGPGPVAYPGELLRDGLNGTAFIANPDFAIITPVRGVPMLESEARIAIGGWNGEGGAEE